MSQRLQPPSPPGPRGNLIPHIPPAASAPLPLLLDPAPVKLPQPDPLRAGHDLEVGTFYYNRGDYVGALARFDDAIYYNPGMAESYCRAADTEWKMRRYAPALAQWRRCLTEGGSRHWGRYARRQLAKHQERP
ncbi:MAG: hypothetical protein ACRD1Y_12305 [Terriglobales bacterium]